MVTASRNKYFDALRAMALVRVVIYHAFGWVWFPYLFPSMGIMFALAGSLMCASLNRTEGQRRSSLVVVWRRLRRLLPPMWALGVVLVPLMVWVGWTAEDSGGSMGVSTLWLWVLPVSDPPGSDWGMFAGVGTLWYLGTYLWLVLLSPPLYWSFRRWPVQTTIGFPLAGWLIVNLIDNSALYLAAADGSAITRVSDVVSNLAIYGGCWMLGFAHNAGLLRRASLSVIVPITVTLMSLGTLYALANPHPTDDVAIDVIAPAQALYCFGAVLLLLHFNPSFGWVTHRPILNYLIASINARAVTIYLWNSAAVLGAAKIMDLLYGEDDYSLNVSTGALYLAFVFLLLVCATLMFGWVEDLAARRPPSILPPVTKSAIKSSGLPL